MPSIARKPWSTLLLFSATCLTLGGCPAGGFNRKPAADAPTDNTPTLARMRAAYPDLRSGRFQILADFNTAPQAELTRIVDSTGNPQDRQQPVITVLRSRNETGPGGLEALLHPGDQLRFDAARTESLALPRDWTEYALLLMSVYGPEQGVQLEFAITSGGDNPLTYRKPLNISPGWNLVRVDMQEVADQVDLTNVRAMTWAAPGLTTDLALYLDDIVLADNRQDVVIATDAEGSLYAYSRGRRLIVGARGRFEIAFADGAIVSWKSAAGVNLAPAAGLGPWPIPLSDDWRYKNDERMLVQDPALFSHWGTTVATSQQFIETSPTRVIVETRREFVPDQWSEQSDPTTGRPAITWRFCIYPSGAAYVHVVTDAGDRGWRSARAGYAIAVDAAQQFKHIPPDPAYAAREPVTFALLSLAGATHPDLLWTFAAPRAIAAQAERPSPDNRQSAILVGDAEPADVLDSAQLLRFWPADVDATPEAESFAGDYQHPARITSRVGQIVTDVPGDLDADGYNESEGCYELRPDGDLLRVQIDPGIWLRRQPLLRVHGVAGRRCWVYAEGRIVTTTARDRDDNLLVTIPWVVNEPITVEVDLREISPESAPPPTP